MPSMPFTKMSGAGNDFIVFDNRQGRIPQERGPFVAHICRRRLGIGADGVLVLELSGSVDFKMRYYNADGGEAEMCGNGGRCVSRFAYLRGAAGRTMEFETQAGVHRSEVIGDRVKLDLPDPTEIRLDLALKVDGQALAVHFANSGVPHTVLWLDDVEGVDVLGLGRKIRHHRDFAPAGTNADFAQVTGPHTMAVRTYERGVEDETLGCGTGVVATSVLGGLLGLLRSPVEALTRSGVALKVHFDLEGGRATHVSLQGDAVVVYEGTLEVPW